MPPDERVIDEACNRAAGAMRTIAALLDEVETEQVDPGSWLDLSARIGELLYEFDEARKMISSELGLTSARQRLLEYLRQHTGEVVTRQGLNGVGAIDDWARRVRELRVEHGWPISTAMNRADLGAGEYVLERNERDESIAERWATAKRIRNLNASAKERGLLYLTAIYPEIADKEDMKYVCNIASYARRMRELEEDGWEIVTNTDDPSMAPGSYRLGSLERRPERSRRAIKQRNEILERDRWTCQRCGRSPDTDRVSLQVHHKRPVHQLGGNEDENLITLCRECHAGEHSADGPTATADELLEPGEDPWRRP